MSPNSVSIVALGAAGGLLHDYLFRSGCNNILRRPGVSVRSVFLLTFVFRLWPFVCFSVVFSSHIVSVIASLLTLVAVHVASDFTCMSWSGSLPIRHGDLAIFSIEIVLSSLGKHDYFMGFFFILDVVATSTLVIQGIMGTSAHTCR